MRKKLGWLLLLLIVVVLIISTSTPQPTSNEAASQPAAPKSTPPPVSKVDTSLTRAFHENLMRRWLSGVPCPAPCWEGITPGKTTAQEAVSILQNNTLVKNVMMTTPVNARGRIEWDWANEKGGGYAHYSFKTTTDTIDDIYPAIKVVYTLKLLITAYGEPSHILATAEKGIDTPGGFYTIILTYLPQGFSMEAVVFTQNGENKPVIGDDLTFDRGPYIFGANPSKAMSDRLRLSSSLPWQGYQTFDYYCRNRNSSWQKDCSNVKLKYP